jgi:hypothetical protein
MLPNIPHEVKVKDEMVGGEDTIKYSDHDIANVVKFPDLVPQNYLEIRGELQSRTPRLEPTQWILGLYNIGIMNFLDVPHFGCGKHINGCVKQLLARVHGGIIWMDRPVPINVDLISEITGLPMDGEKLEQYLEEKMKEKSISDEIKAKYGVERGNMGINISDINDPTMRFVTRLLGCKLMCKCRKEEVPTGVVAIAAHCAKGSSMSWGPYILNYFLEDCKDT